MKHLLEAARNQISEGKYPEFFRIIEDISSHEQELVDKTNFLSLKNRYKINEDEFDEGIITVEHYKVEQTRITRSCIKLVDNIFELFKSKEVLLLSVNNSLKIVNDFLVIHEKSESTLTCNKILFKFCNNDPRSGSLVLEINRDIHKLIIIQGNSQEGKSTICEEIRKAVAAKYLDLKSFEKEKINKLLNQPQGFCPLSKGVWIIDNFDYAVKIVEENILHLFFQNISDKYFINKDLQVILAMKYNSFIDNYPTTSKILNLKIKLLSDVQQKELSSQFAGNELLVLEMGIGTFEPIENILGVPIMLQNCCNLLISNKLENADVKLKRLYLEFYNTIFSGSNRLMNLRKSFSEWLAFRCVAERYDADFSFSKGNNENSILNMLFLEWIDSHDVKKDEYLDVVQIIKELYYFFEINYSYGTFNWKNDSTKFFLAKLWIQNAMNNIPNSKSRSDNMKLFTWGVICLLDSSEDMNDFQNFIKIHIAKFKEPFVDLLRSGWLFKDYPEYIKGTLINCSDSKFFIPPIEGYFKLWNILREFDDNTDLFSRDLVFKNGFKFLINARRFLINENDADKQYFPLDLSHIDLSDMNLVQSLLADADFSNSILSGVNFSFSDLRRSWFEKNSINEFTRFDDANLDKSTFKSINILSREEENTSFKNAKLGDFFNVQFSHVDFQKSRFCESKIEKSDFTSCSFQETKMIDIMIMDTVFEKSNFKKSIFSYTELPLKNDLGVASVFKNVTFKEIDFKESSLNYIDFRFTKIEKVYFVDCNLRSAVFSEMRIMNPSFLNEENLGKDSSGNNELTTFKGSDLSFADLSNSEFINIDFSDCMFIATVMKGAIFEKCIFDNSIFSCDMQDVKFVDCQKQKAIIATANPKVDSSGSNQ